MAPEPAKPKRRWPWQNEQIVVPVFDDVNCPYGVKPSELFKLNEDKDMSKLKELGGVTGLCKTIKTDQQHGLDPASSGHASIDEHRRVFGSNTFPPVPQKNFFALCWENIQDPIILLLIAAALVSTVLGAALEEQRKEGEWIEGIAIWVAVVIVIMVGAGNDYQKDLQFRKLNAQKDIIEVTVTRGGQTLMVKNTDLVVGDVYLVNMGDKVVADGVMIDGFHLVIDEASLTGESDPIKKNPEEDPWVRSGTQVSEGSGRLLVVATGTQSEWGKTMALVGGAGGEDTPLQEKLADLAAAIGKIGFGVAVACFIALLIKWCVENKGFPIAKINQNGPVQFFLYAVTIVVVAVPEGLPLAVTIALAYSMKKMMKDNNFVRVLAACETMGGATAICSDKTGTLTENRMTVVEGWFSGVQLDHAPTREELRPELIQELAHNNALNSKAFLIEHADLPIEFVGNRTECALLMLTKKWGIDYKQVREDYASRMVEVYAFTSAKKMASVLVKHDDATLRLYNKGAAEWVLKRCVALHNEYGEVVPMTEGIREQLLQTVVAMASRGLRCICLSYRDYAAVDGSRPADFFEDADRVDRDLIATAIVGIKDPVRQEVPHAVRVCQNAGIMVRMVTGDNIHTARHIARDCGILTEAGVALEGPNFRNMPAHDLIPLLPKLQVLARSSPEDKLTLVSLLKKEGEVVAVTGDGTNDAPALKESDVGLAMGIAGTEVAKEAADIVIMDDNFSSIVKAVLWGRSVFNSIRKFLQFQLTVNFVALVVAFVGAIIGGRIPLNVLQLLWVNLIMDTMGALALATEDPNPALLDDKPHGRDEHLITPKMWKHILIQGLYQMFWLFFFMYGAPVLFERYRITDHCSFATQGPHEAHPDPMFCTNELVSKLGFQASHASVHCSAMTSCGWSQKCGDAKRDTPACKFQGFITPGPVPGDAASAYSAAFGAAGDCSSLGFNGGCPSIDDYYKAVSHFDKAYLHEGEEDWQKADSVLFNAFIWLQMLNEVNARRINDELNVFEGIHKSPIFIGVLLVTAGLQVIIMQTPVGRFFKVIPINGVEWGVSIAIGLSAVPVSVLTRLLSRFLPSLRIPRRRHGRRTNSSIVRVHNEALALHHQRSSMDRRSMDRAGGHAHGAGEVALPSVKG
ncbi:hypothetical protein OEZ85_004399 [Tetradesmus obliquus]|uniref:Calcium-transporting ATPase n=1 Tax=Tetradesmus obliquus TaxID=3088 RepID=A0ABY8UM17_TETOB|nr:hypothetical protein OEZ85_004399 [Tetradesmus obliquus]